MCKSYKPSFAMLLAVGLLSGGVKSYAQQTVGNNIFSVIEPENLGLLQDSIKAYVISGSYYRDITSVIDSAKGYIESRQHVNKPAIVLDIDETSLSNYEFEVKYGFGCNATIWRDWIFLSKDSAISQTLSLTKWADAQGIAVFFVTGRPLYVYDTLNDPTVLNLKAVNYPSWKGIYFKPPMDTTVVFKTRSRKSIELDRGYTIIANIGDQYSDLLGGYYQRAFKLPDPLYYVP